MEKIPCKKCGEKALHATIQKTGGYCMPCFKGSNKKSFWQRSEDIAVRMGLMQDSDRVNDVKIPERTEVDSLGSVEGESYGQSIGEILSDRGKVDDYLLVCRIDGLLMEKENKTGFNSFTEHEKAFFVVGDMIRQLDSGGFGTYFYNTGHLAHLLINSLVKIGSKECKEIAESAISKYGKTPSSNYDEMLDELDKITNGFNDNPWEKQDDCFYNLAENLGNLLMDYAQNNSNQFQL